MKKLIPILSVLLFPSCDPGVINRFVVDNRTDSEIKIETILKPERRNISERDSIHSVELAPYRKSLIVEYGEIGNAHDKGTGFLEGIDTIIINNWNKTLDKNIFERNNWTYKVITKGFFTLDAVEYRLILTEESFK